MLGRLQLPPGVKRGEAFRVRVIVQHPMETGFRRDYDGKVIPLDIVDQLVCTYAGREVFRAELGSGIAANPYFAFYVLWWPPKAASWRSNGATITGKRAASSRK